MKTVALALMDTLLWTLHSLETSAGGFRGNFTGEEMLQHCGAGEKNPVTDFGRGICSGFIDGFAAEHCIAEAHHAFHHRDEKSDEICRNR
jgi:hypothetical protein